MGENRLPIKCDQEKKKQAKKIREEANKIIKQQIDLVRNFSI
jgi:hypothetical protein